MPSSKTADAPGEPSVEQASRQQGDDVSPVRKTKRARANEQSSASTGNAAQQHAGDPDDEALPVARTPAESERVPARRTRKSDPAKRAAEQDEGKPTSAGARKSSRPSKRAKLDAASEPKTEAADAKKTRESKAPRKARTSTRPKRGKSALPEAPALAEADTIDVEPGRDALAPTDVESIALDSWTAKLVQPVQPIPVTGPPLPYHPSVPCASCARGTDPLRAACISMTESSVHYFCSRECRVSYVRSEAEHHEKVARAPVPPVAPARETTRSFAFESVARRMAPAPPSTPVWPLIAALAVGAVGVASPAIPVHGGEQFAALALAALGAAFASRATLTREQGSVFGWLSAPVGVAALALAGALSRDLKGPLGLLHSQLALAAAALGVLTMWLREHWLEREQAVLRARRHELEARLSPRVRIASNRPDTDDGEPAPLEERALAQLQPGDELVLDAGAVTPVDGVVVSGFGELLPYPGARLPVARSRGQLVLAGSLLAEGTLRVRALEVGDRCALFRAFREPSESEEAEGRVERIARGAAGIEHGLKLLIPLALLAAFAVHPMALKLAAFGASLLVLPAVGLARGLRAAQRRALTAGAARGVSYREPASLERAGVLDTAVLRVEGPLVSRRYTLTEIIPLSDTHDARALLELAVAAGAVDEAHGIARAVREHAQEQGVEPAQLKRLLHTRGRGISGLTDGQGAFVFGSRAALLSAGVSVAVADREAQRAEQLGQRVVFLALGGRARGLFVFTQTVQPEARVALQTLFDLGLEVELVSGDHRPTIEAIARTLDITQVKAELSSEQRAAEVRRLRDGEAKVVAIGHVPADQALLAAADLSVSLDASQPPGEHDVTFDITTASPDLRDAAAALSLARRARREAQQTMALAALGVALSLLCAVGALHPVIALALSPCLDWLCLARAWGVQGDPSAPKRRRLQ